MSLLKPACWIIHYGDADWDCNACDAVGVDDTAVRDACLSPTEMAYATSIVSITLTLLVMLVCQAIIKPSPPEREQRLHFNPRGASHSATVPQCYSSGAHGVGNARVTSFDELNAMASSGATWPPRPPRPGDPRGTGRRGNIRYKTIHSSEELEAVLQQSRSCSQSPRAAHARSESGARDEGES